MVRAPTSHRTTTTATRNGFREEIQFHPNRQRKLAASPASAPLQQQIADLNKLVANQQAQTKKLIGQIQTDSALALQSKADDRFDEVQVMMRRYRRAVAR
jgi:hypothetical protein